MVGYGAGEDEQQQQETIDWEHLLDDKPGDFNFDGFLNEPTPTPDWFTTTTPPESDCSLSIDDIEQFLLKDDDKDQHVVACLDSSSSGSGSPRSVDDEGKQNDMEKNVGDDDNGDDDDAKKRKRQMRNRDAAVRSRERKKMYVRDLEMKSKYYEAECRRLGFMLQCCLAENQALRFSLHASQAVDASMTKQESAVLLLESLLLGSLLGFLGIIMYLLILPGQFLSILETGLLENVDNVEWGSPAPRRTGNEVPRAIPVRSLMMGKGYKASRSRMKLTLPAKEVTV